MLGVGQHLPEFRIVGVKAGFNEHEENGVSAINGCGACLDAHEAELRKHGLSAPQVQAALRIGAVVHAAGRIVASEAALAA
jgi:AhpD family alkylhydroperoxidase